MDTIRLADINNNKYLITSEALKYHPITKLQSSSGTYSGGDPKEIAITAEQWQECQALAQAICDNTSIHTDKRQMLTSVLKVSNGLHKETYIITRSEELNALISYMNTLLDV